MLFTWHVPGQLLVLKGDSWYHSWITIDFISKPVLLEIYKLESFRSAFKTHPGSFLKLWSAGLRKPPWQLEKIFGCFSELRSWWSGSSGEALPHLPPMIACPYSNSINYLNCRRCECWPTWAQFPLVAKICFYWSGKVKQMQQNPSVFISITNAGRSQPQCVIARVQTTNQHFPTPETSMNCVCQKLASFWREMVSQENKINECVMSCWQELAANRLMHSILMCDLQHIKFWGVLQRLYFSNMGRNVFVHIQQSSPVAEYPGHSYKALESKWT